MSSDGKGLVCQAGAALLWETMRVTGLARSLREGLSLNSAAPLKPLPEPVDLERYRVRRHVRISGMINEYRLAA